MKFIFIYATFSSRKEAEKISMNLLEKKLIACANLVESKSFYYWKGKKQEQNETIAFMKSHERHWEKIKKEILAMHSYEIPCIIKFKAEANREYEEWAETETNSER